MIPLRNFGVDEQRIVPAQEPGSISSRHPIKRWVILSSWISGILPVTILRFIDCEPILNIRIPATDDELRIVEEVIHDLGRSPSSVFVEQSKRGVPMKQGDTRPDPVLVQFGNHVVVMFDACCVDRAFTKRKDAWPRERRTEC